jgi:peptide chain release factor 3
VTPVFFGSAMNNFGLEPFLDQFVDLAQSPRTRTTSIGPLEADNPNFSGVVV